MIAAAPRERSGGASGMLGTARLLGQTTGAALVALFLARYPSEGTQISLFVGVGFALLGAALQHAALVAGRRARRRAGAGSRRPAPERRMKTKFARNAGNSRRGIPQTGMEAFRRRIMSDGCRSREPTLC